MSFELENLTPLLQVFDMRRSIAFYCDLLGFAIVNTSNDGDDYGWAMLRRGGATLMLNTAYDDDERPAAPDASRVVGHGDTTLYFGCRDVDAVYAHLRDRGCDVQPPHVTNYGMRQILLKDPDGFEICFLWSA